MAQIGHDEWEREAVQDLDERGHVRVVVPGVACVFRVPPTPEQVAQFLAAHAPTPMAEARAAELDAVLATRGQEVEALVRARAPAGTRQSIADAERARAWQQVRAAVADELAEARQVARAGREASGELRPLRPLTLGELTRPQ